jgi:uncharacterized membrane protein YccC
MARSCDECAFPYLPYHEKCLGCGKTLQTPDDAEEARRRWMQIPAAERQKAEAEIQKKVAQMGVTRHAYSKIAQRVQAFIGGTLLGILAGFTIPAIGPVHIGINVFLLFVAGFILTLWLHTSGGGAVKGMFSFEGAYFLMWLIGMAVTPDTSGFEFIRFLFGMLLAPMIGVSLGLLISGAHSRAGDTI